MKNNNSNIQKLASKWMQLCDDDIKSALVEFKETQNYTLICFLCQQAVERYLKAYLMVHNIEPQKIHQLIKLLDFCANIDKDFVDWQEECDFLNKFYIETRYPVYWGSIRQKEEARKSIEYAEEIIKFIKKNLKS